MSKYIKTSFLIISCSILFSSSVRALSSAQTDVFNLGIHYFNTESLSTTTTCSVNVDPTLSGTGQVEQAFNYFVSQGLSAAQAAGILGNLKAESGVIPTQIQNPPGGNSNDPNAAGSEGWGIAQWTPGIKVIDAASQLGVNGPIYELSTQLQIVMGEMKNTSPTGVQDMLQGLMQINDPKTATDYFEQNFEAAKGGGDLSNREKFAQEIFDQYGNNSGTIVQAPSPTGGCSTTSPGQNTQYIDGFTVYSQYDPQWANKPYGTSTIAASGCGPSAMAMIITNLTKQQVTPDITAAYADSQGLYVDGQGSSWSIGPVLAKRWGLQSSALSKSVQSITAALQSGSLVIVAGKGPEPFTSGGHFIVIRAVTSDGKWMVGDSAHPDANTQSWDPQQLLVSMSDGSIYAVYK